MLSEQNWNEFPTKLTLQEIRTLEPNFSPNLTWMSLDVDKYYIYIQ